MIENFDYISYLDPKTQNTIQATRSNLKSIDGIMIRSTHTSNETILHIEETELTSRQFGYFVNKFSQDPVLNSEQTDVDNVVVFLDITTPSGKKGRVQVMTINETKTMDKLGSFLSFVGKTKKGKRLRPAPTPPKIKQTRKKRK
jgi:hypothetical protein